MNPEKNILNIQNQEPEPNFRKFRGYSSLFLSLIFFIEAFIVKDKTIVNLLFFGGIIAFIGVTYISVYKGYLFDFTLNQIKSYTTFVFIRFGNWKELSQVSRIVLDKYTTKFKLYDGKNLLNSDVYKNTPLQTFRLCISYKNLEKFDLIIHTKKYQTALGNGRWLAEKWNLPLENRIERN